MPHKNPQTGPLDGLRRVRARKFFHTLCGLEPQGLCDDAPMRGTEHGGRTLRGSQCRAVSELCLQVFSRPRKQSRLNLKNHDQVSRNGLSATMETGLGRPRFKGMSERLTKELRRACEASRKDWFCSHSQKSRYWRSRGRSPRISGSH